MEGIQYVTDEAGNKKAIQIDLEKYGELVEELLASAQKKNSEKEGEKKQRPSEKYKGALSDETAKKMHEYVEKSRLEWER